MRPVFGVFAASLALSLAALPAHAAWPHDPAVNLPVTAPAGTGQYLIGSGREEAVSDGQGGIICVWDQFTSVDNIRAQRIDAAGNRLWGPSGILVQAGTIIAPFQFEAIPDGSGGAIMAWGDPRNGNQDIYAQRISSSGTLLWGAGGVAVCTAPLSQQDVRLASDGSGGAWIVWADGRSGGFDIYARRVNSAGVPQGAANGIAVCTAAGNQIGPRVASVPQVAGLSLVWQDQRTDAGDIYAQRLDVNGTPTWTSNGVAICATTGIQRTPVLVDDGNVGLVAAWTDNRAAGDIYAQRLNAAGTPQWTANGVPACAAPNSQFDPAIAADGAGAAVITFADLRNSSFDIYAQRISIESGAALWPGDGVAVCAELGPQLYPLVVADGTGGTYVAWYDQRQNSYGDIYVQRLNVSGYPQWQSGGVPVGVTPRYEYGHTLVSAGAEGCIVQFARDNQAGQAPVVAQKIDRWGYLGGEPSMVSATDVPNDQGGRVKVSWLASPLDYDPLFGVIQDYLVFRSVPTGAAQRALAEGRVTDAIGEVAPASPGQRPRLLRVQSPDGIESFWETVALQGAQRLDSYSAVVPTTGDSVAGSNPLTEFMVQARGWSGGSWNSGVATGYSVDDLAPAAPAPFEGQYNAGSTLLTWGASTEADLAYYRLYRGPLGFKPSPANLVAQPTTTTYSDAAGGPFVYKLTAVDTHGNESPAATVIPSGTVDVGGPAAAVDFLAAPAPNPARAGAPVRLRFGLARAGHAELALHDLQGRRVAVLVDDERTAGTHSAVLDGAGLAPGVYLARLTTPGYRATRRLLVVR